MSQTYTTQQRRDILQSIAERTMRERGLLPGFSDAAATELEGMQGPVTSVSGPDATAIRDLTGLVRASIDNDDSRDLDQLTVKDHTHSTAPVRRYPDLITQRLLKAAIAGRAAPHSYDDLDVLTKHFTAQEDAANKLQRQIGKSAAAMLPQSRMSEQFNALVARAAEKGTWVRLLTVPVKGRAVRGFEGVDVGEELRGQLVSVDVESGFIDFSRVDSTPATTRRTA